MNNPHGYRIRSWIGQKEGLRQAVSMFANALHNPADGLRALSRVGVSFSRKQRFIISVLYRVKPVWAQRLMLFWMK
jgi:hypothetical protein